MTHKKTKNLSYRCIKFQTIQKSKILLVLRTWLFLLSEFIRDSFWIHLKFKIEKCILINAENSEFIFVKRTCPSYICTNILAINIFKSTENLNSAQNCISTVWKESWISNSVFHSPIFTSNKLILWASGFSPGETGLRDLKDIFQFYDLVVLVFT